MSEPIDWSREVEETESDYTKHLKKVMDRPKEIKEEKRAVSEVAVKKGLPVGITKNIGKFIGRTEGGKKSRKVAKKKTRRVTKKKTSKRKGTRK